MKATQEYRAVLLDRLNRMTAATEAQVVTLRWILAVLAFIAGTLVFRL